MKSIRSLLEIQESLLQLGYEAVLKDQAVVVKVGGLEHPFIAVVTENHETNAFNISCLVTRFGEIGEENLLHFTIAALDANIRIRPFAYALLVEGGSDDGEDWQVILTHSIPWADLSGTELASAMKSLVTALMDSVHVLDTIPKRPKAKPVTKPKPTTKTRAKKK